MEISQYSQQYHVMRTTEYYELTYETPLSNQAYIICEIIYHLERQLDLASCCLVSRLWNTCATPILWRVPYMKRDSTFDKFIRTLVRTRQHATLYAYGCFIQKLDLSRLSTCTAAELGLISESCGVLKYIDFSYVRELRDDVLSRISGQCSDLKTLKLLNLPLITDHSLIQIIERCHILEHLAIGDCSNITSKSFLQLSKSAEYLSTLEIYVGNTIENETFTLITKNCLRLKNLHIWDCGNLDDNSIINMANDMNINLESLILQNLRYITDISMKEIAIKCFNIRNLSIEPYEGITNETLEFISNYCLNIESFQISLKNAVNISNNGFLLLAERMRKLNKLTFQDSTPYVNDVTLSMLIIRNSENLTYLHLYHCNFTDSSLRVLENICPPISDLCLSSMSDITDEPTIALLGKISSTLVSLQISNCDGLTEEIAISGIGKYCKGLRKLSFFPSTDFTIRDLDAIVSVCTQLKEFNLASTEDIPNTIIGPTLTRLRYLEKLQILGCSNLTQDDVATICCGCSQLQELFLGHSEHLTDGFIENYNFDGRKKPLLVLS